MGKYDGKTEVELMEAWKNAKPGVNKPILKALASHGTPAAAAFIHDCIRKQSTGPSARSVIEVLISMGPPAAPWLAKMLLNPDTIMDARVDEWEQALAGLGDAGQEAAAQELESTIAAYREAFRLLDEDIARLPESLRQAAREKALLGWGYQVNPGEAAALNAQTVLLARWAPHMDPAYNNWDIAWQSEHALLNNLALGIERLSEIAGAPLTPRVPIADGNLKLVVI